MKCWHFCLCRCPCMGASKLGAGLQHPFTHIEQYLVCSSPSTNVQDWAGHTFSVNKFKPSRKDCQGKYHHQPDSISQGTSQHPSFAFCLALTRTWFCTVQLHIKKSLHFVRSGEKILPTAHNGNLLISQTVSPNCIITSWQARTRQHH